MVGRKEKTPLEEMKNLLEPLARMTDTHCQHARSIPDAKPKHTFPGLETPVNRNIAKPLADYETSAMKGVVFTATGETLTTPTPAELTNLFVNSPRVGLNFAKIFDFEKRNGEGEEGSDRGEDESDVEGPPPSPSIRDRAKSESKSVQQRDSSAGVPPTRLRRPSIRRSVQRPGLPASTSDPTGLSALAPPSKTISSKRPSSSAAAAPKRSATVPQPSSPEPEYDFSDEENLPSPFLKRVEKEKSVLPGMSGVPLRNKGPNKRPSGGNHLRAVAAANAANANVNAVASSDPASAGKGSIKNSLTRPSVTSARKAGEEARKALLRQ